MDDEGKMTYDDLMQCLLYKILVYK